MLPSNITFGIMPPLAQPPRGRVERKTALSERALSALADWMSRTEDSTLEAAMSHAAAP